MRFNSDQVPAAIHKCYFFFRILVDEKALIGRCFEFTVCAVIVAPWSSRLSMRAREGLQIWLAWK